MISRPAVSVRRVTPSSSAHKNIPMAPGRKAIGEVREFKVVPDHLGRGRELVDVTKKKEGTGGKKRTAEKDGQMNKQEISDLMWGRVSIPLRGKKRKPTKKGAKTQITEMAEEKKIIKLQEAISVSDLGQRMGVKTTDIIKKLMAGGTMATANQMLDADTAAIVATDYGWKVEKVGFEVEDHLPDVKEQAEDERPRPPVVTVMGHVDHGKTSLLDAIRAANVAAGEAGGITQHIGAYTVKTAKGDITFLDTPGHEAFTAMRARGATVTDIVVLVVASDDGVMPQTVEALNHAKAAKVPIVVAINKMDVPGANPERVKQDLAKNELVPEDWGGDTIMVGVSAKTKAGIDLLLENLALQAEVLELTANPSRPAVGAIIEAKLEKGRGAVATVLVREGTLRVGDSIVSGIHSGKVRAMSNSRGESIKEVLPGYSAEVVGLDGVPTAGDVINVVEGERAAKEIAEHREMKARQADAGKTSRESLEVLLAKTKAGASSNSSNAPVAKPVPPPPKAHSKTARPSTSGRFGSPATPAIPRIVTAPSSRSPARSKTASATNASRGRSSRSTSLPRKTAPPPPRPPGPLCATSAAPPPVSPSGLSSGGKTAPASRAKSSTSGRSAITILSNPPPTHPPAPPPPAKSPRSPSTPARPPPVSSTKTTSGPSSATPTARFRTATTRRATSGPSSCKVAATTASSIAGAPSTRIRSSRARTRLGSLGPSTAKPAGPRKASRKRKPSSSTSSTGTSRNAAPTPPPSRPPPSRTSGLSTARGTTAPVAAKSSRSAPSKSSSPATPRSATPGRPFSRSTATINPPQAAPNTRSSGISFRGKRVLRLRPPPLRLRRSRGTNLAIARSAKAGRPKNASPSRAASSACAVPPANAPGASSC